MSAVNFNHPRSEIIILLSQVCYYAIMNGNAEIYNQAHRRNNVPCSLLSRAGVSAGQWEGGSSACAHCSDTQPELLTSVLPTTLAANVWVSHQAGSTLSQKKINRAAGDSGKEGNDSQRSLSHKARETCSTFTSTLLKAVCAPQVSLLVASWQKGVCGAMQSPESKIIL